MPRLRRVSCSSPGLTRVRRGTRAIYIDAAGRPVTDAATLRRIEALVLPPAWRDVWICRQRLDLRCRQRVVAAFNGVELFLQFAAVLLDFVVVLAGGRLRKLHNHVNGGCGIYALQVWRVFVFASGPQDG